MNERATKAELLQIIAAEHQAWQELLAAIGADRMMLLGAAGPDWTVKDVIAHLTAWRGRTIAHLRAGLAHADPAPPPWPDHLDEDAPGGVGRINTWFHDTDRPRPLADILRESEESWRQVADLVGAIPEADLCAAGRFAWMGGAPLGVGVLDPSFDHLHEHIHMLAVQAWAALPKAAAR
jgi:hypothetical protein